MSKVIDDYLDHLERILAITYPDDDNCGGYIP